MDGLTAEEGVVADAVLAAVNGFAKLERQHPNEEREFVDAIHRVQDLLCVRIARRAFPWWLADAHAMSAQHRLSTRYAGHGEWWAICECGRWNVVLTGGARTAEARWREHLDWASSEHRAEFDFLADAEAKYRRALLWQIAETVTLALVLLVFLADIGVRVFA